MGSLTVYVTHNTSKVAVDVDLDATVRDLEAEAAKQLNLSTPLTLLYGGSKLDPGDLVSNTGIVADAELEVDRCLFEWFGHHPSLKVQDTERPGDTIRLDVPSDASGYRNAVVSKELHSGVHTFTVKFTGGTNGATIGFMDIDSLEAMRAHYSENIYKTAYVYTNHGSIVREGSVPRIQAKPFNANDVVSATLDLEERKISFTLNYTNTFPDMPLLDSHHVFCGVVGLYTSQCTATFVD
eukprot:Sspe_Gene.110775::Locus_91841_Transcript_1_1_Confidence_1.000_Length_964::g.110775::m.110775